MEIMEGWASFGLCYLMLWRLPPHLVDIINYFYTRYLLTHYQMKPCKLRYNLSHTGTRINKLAISLPFYWHCYISKGCSSPYNHICHSYQYGKKWNYCQFVATWYCFLRNSNYSPKENYKSFFIQSRHDCKH